jgi:putative peptidoglycan lipid II flippase
MARKDNNHKFKIGSVRNTVQTAALMIILTLLSKFMGFLREMAMANYYGTSMLTDAYVMAIAVPGILFGGLVTAIATAYMPIFSLINEKDGEKPAIRYTNITINLMIVVGILSAVIGILFSKEIVSIFAYGFQGETARLTSVFVKFTFSCVIITAIMGVLNSFLQYRGVFLSQIIIGCLQSVIVIAFITISFNTVNQYIIYGYILGVFLQLLFYIRLSRTKGYVYTPTLDLGGHTKELMRLAVPVFIGGFANTIGDFVDKTLASSLVVGSVAALNYGLQIIRLVNGLTIAIISTLIYPKLNQARSCDDRERFNYVVSSGITIVIMITIPCALGAMLFDGQIIQVVYERGAFDVTATEMTKIALYYYAIGLPFGAIYALLSNVFLSLHNSRIPAILGFVIVSVDVTLNFILIGPMKLAGLALSTSIGSIVGAILYYAVLRKKYPTVLLIESPTKIVKIILMGVGSVVVAKLAYTSLAAMTSNIIFPRTLMLFIAVMVAVVVYCILLKLFKIEELNLLKQLIKKY